MAFQFYIKINNLNKKNLTQVKPGFKIQLHPNRQNDEAVLLKSEILKRGIIRLLIWSLRYPPESYYNTV